MDSAPIFRILYCPATTSPSLPLSEWPVVSISDAIFLGGSPASTTPANLSVIGGGGGGPAGRLGPTPTGGVVLGGTGGGAFGLKRNRFRLAGPCFGRSSSRARR